MDAFLKFLKSVEDEVPLRKVPTGILRMFFQAGRDSAVKELKTPGKVLIDEDMPEHGVTNPRFMGCACHVTKDRVEKRKAQAERRAAADK